MTGNIYIKGNLYITGNVDKVEFDNPDGITIWVGGDMIWIDDINSIELGQEDVLIENFYEKFPIKDVMVFTRF